MNTISMILAWIVVGIIALVGGAVIGMALSNSLNAKYRRHNWVAWQVLTHQNKHGDVFIIKDKVLANKIQGVIDGKLYIVKTKRTAKYRQDIAALIDLASDFIGIEDHEPRSIACIEAAIKHGIWLQRGLHDGTR